MLKLSIVDSNGNTTEIDTRKVTISAEPPGDLKDSSRRDIGVTHTDDGVVIRITTAAAYSDWYSGFIARKTIAMQVGGSDGDLYAFEKGYKNLLEEDLNNDVPIFRRVRSVANIKPNSDGDLLILPSKDTDVGSVKYTVNGETKEGILIKAVDDRKRALNIINCYEELTLLIMRLYHAINHLTARVLVMSPGDNTLGRSADELAKIPDNSEYGKMYGTLLNYQATLARWNFLVWASSFNWDISDSGPGFALSIGYTCLTCSVSNVRISTKIVIEKSYPVYETAPEYEVDSSSLLTVYKQGVADTRGDTSSLGKASMTKYTYDEKNNLTSPRGLSGFGFSSEFSYWDEIRIEQTLGQMKQADMCTELFSLFPANNAADAGVYMQSTSSETVLKNVYRVTTEWFVDIPGEHAPYVMTRSKVVSVPALSAIKPENGEQET